MKKITILTVFLLFLTFYSKANIVDKAQKTAIGIVDSTKQAVKDGVNTIDTGSLYKTMYNDAKSGLQGLANALKVGVEHVYTILVKQQVVKSIVWIITILISLLLFIPIVIIAKLIYKNAGYDSGFAITMFCMFASIIPAIGLLVGISNLDVIVTGFVNPEYGAMEQIMQWVNHAAK